MPYITPLPEKVTSISAFEHKLLTGMAGAMGSVEVESVRNTAMDMYSRQFEIGYGFYHILHDPCHAVRGWKNDRAISSEHVCSLVLGMLGSLDHDVANAIPVLVEPEWLGSFTPRKDYDPTEMPILLVWAEGKGPSENLKFLICGGNHRYWAAGVVRIVLRFEIEYWRLELKKWEGAVDTVSSSEDNMVESQDEEEDGEEPEGSKKKKSAKKAKKQSAKKKGGRKGKQTGGEGAQAKDKGTPDSGNGPFDLHEGEQRFLDTAGLTVSALKTMASNRVKDTVAEWAEDKKKVEEKRELSRLKGYRAEARVEEMGRFVIRFFDHRQWNTSLHIYYHVLTRM